MDEFAPRPGEFQSLPRRAPRSEPFRTRAEPRVQPRPESREPQGVRRHVGPAPGGAAWPSPWVQLKYFASQPMFYPAMIAGASPDAKPGDLVAVFDKEGRRFGTGLWNPRARVPLRVLHHGEEAAGEELFDRLIERALDLRLRLLALGENTDAHRVISSDGDGMSGLVVDRYGDTLSVEVHSLGMFQRLGRLLPVIHERLGTKRQVISVDDFIARVEGIRFAPANDVRTVRIREHGVRYEVDFASGHKTGFFCDQRENRRKLAALVKDQRVLDCCCYTGGFALAAKVLGGAADVTGVDLDEKAIEQAKRNANLNQARIDWVHCDAFSFARQMQRNNTRWPVVILDPPKFLQSREEELEGRRKYEDLNGMGMNVLEPGGLLVTCSCSGLIDMEGFEELVTRAAYRLGRRLQFLDRTGAGADHPVMANCLESRYLKVIWARVW
ncbi:MAG: class I SAM-dependent rRNA methyltransferase [Verrucomicrobia bacterium]|nr:class I SAM-dependent rRNA methyltransferase [Verrucomicrobiota bacterium]